MGYEFHPIASVFPLMDGEEYEKFKQDIQESGLREPIWLYENQIIDGRNRYRACVDLGIVPNYRIWDGQGSLVTFVLSLNLHRRHLSSSQRAVVALEVLPWLEKEYPQGKHQVQKVAPEKNRDRAAKLTRTNRQYVSDAKKIQEKAPDLLDRVRDGSLDIPQAKKEIKRRENEQARAVVAHKGAQVGIPDDARILCGDFREQMLALPDDSVDLIFTDPPYDKESVHLYGDLASAAFRVLRPGGSLLVYAGHHAIPEITELMGRHLRYWWLIALSHQKGNHRRLEGVKVYVHWKPILWYVKDTYKGVRAMSDMYETDVPNKEMHDWAQDIGAASYYIDYLTSPGDMVLDPMCGSGTICKAALLAGRKTVGIEIDEERANVAKYVLYGAQNGQTVSEK